MIISRKFDCEKDLDSVKHLLNKFNLLDTLDSKEIIYILQENNSIIGVSQISIKQKNAILDYVVIDSSCKGNNYGDGLLRSILNYATSIGYHKIYYMDINNYLIKEGFRETNISNDDSLKKIFKNEIILYCDLHEFFSKCCSNTRR